MLTTTEDVLRFIARNGCVTYQELANIFNRTENWSHQKLNDLKKQGLVTNEPKCHWQLTYNGERRLKYYGKRNKDNRKD
jgi:Mn-dependent DtxR family transcriptional regulator